MQHRLAGLSLVVAASLVPLGCGQGASRIPVYPAAGTVLSAGRPAPKAIVLFHPVTPPIAPAGGPEIASIATETDEEGRYRLSTYAANDGAPAGDYVVTVRLAATRAPSVEDGDGGGRPSAPPVGLAKYAGSTTSPFKATIKPGDNRFDFELR